ncbi:MAG: hypothetical protein PVI66_04140 [Candidatus Aminicenantes bacterium]|jgi:hypothetical protein
MKISWLWITTLIVVLAFTSCQSFKLELYPDVNLHSRPGYYSSVSQSSVESLLAEIWYSDFLNRNELNEAEILNNSYGIFGEDSEFAKHTNGRACFIIEEGFSDMVLLNRKLFPHLERGESGEAKAIGRDRQINATLIHELFHDFWYNTLDFQKRFLFSAEAAIFFREIEMIQTKQDMLDFLKEIGYHTPRESDFKPFRELQIVKKNYTDEKFFGTELYSIIADRAYSGKIIIPKPFRKFYNGIISETVLDKGYI